MYNKIYMIDKQNRLWIFSVEENIFLHKCERRETVDQSEWEDMQKKWNRYIPFMIGNQKVVRSRPVSDNLTFEGSLRNWKKAEISIKKIRI